MAEFRGIKAGVEDLPANFHLPRHRHFHAYATLVLAGSFEEAGYAGRIKASAGHLLVHPVLDCHVDRMISPGVRLLRLPWPDTDVVGGLHILDAMDAVVRVAEKDVVEAQEFVQELIRKDETRITPLEDWPDLFAKEVARNPRLRIGDWAEEMGLARETVNRKFSAVYGIPAATFRSEWRARMAWIEVAQRRDRLSTIAAQRGFSDQSHMTRWINRITGSPPSFWR
jgi:AraC-like DNA-binding protein